jgi:ribosomal-protein-alanine N-acetyltransferase
MISADVPAVASILKKCSEAAQWSAVDLLAAETGDIYVWVVEEGGELAGMVAARAAGGEAEVLNVAVLPNYRRRGLGRSLLQVAIAELRAAGAGPIFLEVRESNSAACAFYSSLGFSPSGRRRAYYRHPDEDAIVLTLPPNPA